MTDSRKRLSTGLALATLVLAAAAGGAGAAYFSAAKDGASAQPTQPVLATLDLPDVGLVDQFGHTRKFISGLDRDALIVVNFNYTTCESICPVGNALMKEIDAAAPARISRPVRLMSITIDPRRDTPAVMRRAAEEFDPSDRWLWLTGEQGDIDALLSTLGAKPPDITLHSPLFLVGDLRAGKYRIVRAQPEANDMLAALEQFDL